MTRLLRSLDRTDRANLTSPPPATGNGAQRGQHGRSSVSAAAGSSALATVPDTVPMLPDGFDPSSKFLKQLAELILSPDGASSAPEALPTTADGAPALGWICAAGMGGLGKTTMASAVARDHSIRKHFDRVAFVGVGQTPSILSLQQVMYEQLTGALSSFRVEGEEMEEMREGGKEGGRGGESEGREMGRASV